ncbi:hypothetical protein VMCG_00881 [Cytospora schulzeri]|uniref:Uncharacterized protein n=1 Tax=Cytospora schulzeri TaxID=448051 RepID=A0A423X5S4_9PEZI|nr:hypothetical protein VMCG_00881 [Valsa malicola]
MGRPAAPPKDDVRRESRPRSTAIRSARPVEDGPDARYSLMQVPDDPGIHVPTLKRKPEYAHVGSFDGSSDSLNHSRLPKPKSSKRNGSYVARAPPSSRRMSTRPVKPIRDSRQHEGKASSKATRDKRRTVLEPLAEKSLARTLSQQNRLSYLATPPEMKCRPKPASPPSRAPSQRRSLTRFTKELERYCMAVSANGKAPLPLCTPTVSDSPTTLDTVTELLPYHRQFKAAGLAVTSREQMPRIPDSPPPPNVKEVVEIREIPPTPINDPISSGSSSPPTVEENEATIQLPITPPAEMIKATDADEKPPTPLKNDASQQPPPTTDSRHHRGQSLSKQWSKKEKQKLPLASQSQKQSQETKSSPSTHTPEHTSDPVPQLPYTWKQTAVESSSSFEKALDAVIQKLDDMEERRQQERKSDLEAARKTSIEQVDSENTIQNQSKSKPIIVSEFETKTPEKPSSTRVEAASQTEDSVDYHDNDIADRDVLMGLKMAICAACDQDLDAWIREKTGLRLRRFLADLKAFDAPQPLHRQIRRNPNEARRLKAERERRRRSMKKTLLPYFGADGALAMSG